MTPHQRKRNQQGHPSGCSGILPYEKNSHHSSFPRIKPFCNTPTLLCTMKETAETATTSTTVKSQPYSSLKEVIIKTETANLYCSNSVCGFVWLLKKKKKRVLWKNNEKHLCHHNLLLAPQLPQISVAPLTCICPGLTYTTCRSHS